MEPELTYEKALELYGDVPLTFDSYYKYSFSFTGGAADGTAIYASTGGCADDIYRSSVSRDSTILLEDASSFTLSRGGKTVFSHDAY